MKKEKGKMVNFGKAFSKSLAKIAFFIEMFYELKKYNYQKFVKFISKNQLNELFANPDSL